MFFFVFGELFDRQFDVPVQLVGEREQFHFLPFFRGVGVVLGRADLRSVDRRLNAAHSYPDLLILALRVVRKVDRQDLRFLLIGQPQQVLDCVELIHVLAHVQQDFRVGVVDDRLLYNRRGNNIVDLLCYDEDFAEKFANRFE